MSAYRELLDGYVEWYNAGDLDSIMDLYAEDAVQGMPDGVYTGRSAIRDRLAQELGSLSNIDWTVDSYLEQDDLFADEWTIVGTHTGPLTLPDGTQLAPTGRRIQIKGMELVRMRDGEIVVDNLYYDNLSLAAQLGLLPQAAPAAVG